MLDCLGFHVRYEDGSPLEDLVWGDTVAGGTRLLGRMPNKILIAAANERLYQEMLAYREQNLIEPSAQDP